MALVHFSKEDFEKAMASGQVVVVDFWAEWCGPCRMLGPVIDKLAEAYEGKAIVGKVNVDENDDTCAAYGIMNIPTILFFKGGELVHRQVGAIRKPDLQKLFEDLL